MNPSAAQLRPRLENALDFAQAQVRRLIETYPDTFPMYTVDGRWHHRGEAWTNWCEGFLGGMMWIFHTRTTGRRSSRSSLQTERTRFAANSVAPPYDWRRQAEHYTCLIEHRKTDRAVHDLGFLFWSTYKRWVDLTGNGENEVSEHARQVLITAGQTMGLRFKEKGGYLHSFVSQESLFIDIMMNVGIVFYAAQQTADADLLQKAHRHCQTTRRCLVRGDGSAAHEGIFDLETGEFLRQATHQGWRGDSAWARGLAWAIYGFGAAYQMSGETDYLQTARACADFYLKHTDFEGDMPGVPPNDYDDPRQPVLYDSSAAAIAACGLLNLAALLDTQPDPIYRQADLRQAAFTILHTLTGPAYLADQTPGWEGILKHGVYHRARGLGVDESVMWGEYFFVQALDQALTLLDEGVRSELSSRSSQRTARTARTPEAL